MNDFINFLTELINELPINEVTDRSWIEIVSILVPSVLLISVLVGVGFSQQEKNVKVAIYMLCLLLTLLYLPYELFRQASVIAKADEHINITQNQLKDLLAAADLEHLEPLADKKVAQDMLTELINGLSDEQKQSLMFTAWMIAENEAKTVQVVNDQIHSLSKEIKRSLDNIAKEIINSRTPTDKISKEILTGIDNDISRLIEQKMTAFNQQIDQSMGNFQERINLFIQRQLDEYEQMLVNITQQNVQELENYAEQASIAFAAEINKSNEAALQKLEETKKSVDDIEAKLASANLGNLANEVKQLTALMEATQQKNDILFAYNECMRSVGLFDFAGEEQRCRKELHKSLEAL